MKEFSNKKYWLIGAILLAIAAMFVLWNIRERKQSTAVPPVTSVPSVSMQESMPPMVSLTSEAMARAGIGVVPVETKNFSSEINAVGIIEIPTPAERTIAARARGRLRRAELRPNAARRTRARSSASFDAALGALHARTLAPRLR